MFRLHDLKIRGLTAVIGVVVLATLTWLWQQTQSLNSEDRARIDATLRELRSLDRTINQDVLRARYHLIDSYGPVLRSYRRVEELESIIAAPPRYLDRSVTQRLAAAVTDYRAVVTTKQELIETFKYRTTDLGELLGHLPAIGIGVAKAAADSGDQALASDVNELIRLTLLYNLTSDEKYAQVIGKRVDGLDAAEAKGARSPGVKRRIGILVLDIRRLLVVKPAVDRLLQRIFDDPVMVHEEKVAGIYYAGYAEAEHTARRYRVVLYGVCIALFGLLAFGVRRLQHSAKALAISNARLEERVAERTRELDARNREMRVVLDNVDQALFTVDLEGRLERQRSAALDRWFPGAAPGTHVWDVLERADPETAAWMNVGWDQMRSAILPTDVALDQLPRTLTNGVRHYEIGYRPIGDEASPEKILLVVSDVSELVERARREADQQEQLVIFQHVMRDGPEFEEFFNESQHLVEEALGGRLPDHAALMRAIHTVKGNCGMYGVASVAKVCHDLESRLTDGGGEGHGGLDGADLTGLSEVWSSFAKKVRALGGAATLEQIAFTPAELRALREGIAVGRSPSELLRFILEVEREPVERRLTRVSEQAKRIARRLGKGEVLVSIEPNDVRLDGKRWAPFWAAFVHMLRNALDHGIEPPEERLALGKPLAGRLTLRVRHVDRKVVIEISDDGRGIDWAAVRATALARGLTAETEDDLLVALFRGGLSTKRSVTEYSGRGAGLSACYGACRQMGGTLTAASKAGRGSTFRFSIPDDDEAVAPGLTSAA